MIGSGYGYSGGYYSSNGIISNNINGCSICSSTIHGGYDFSLVVATVVVIVIILLPLVVALGHAKCGKINSLHAAITFKVDELI